MLHHHNLIIAEIGSVHDGSFGNACKLIEVAALSGADIAKFQTHIAEVETLADAPMPAYFKGEPRMEYFKRTAFTKKQLIELRNVCDANGLAFMSSPFSTEAVDLLEMVGVSAYKVPSGEVTNLPLLKRIASTGKEIFLSSGMSNWAELDQAVDVLRSGLGTMTVMQCTSAYPCPPQRVGLNIIAEMADRFNLPVGFSDHTDGFAAAIAAASMGATTIEKHITFSRLMYGSDAANAMEPDDFRQYCRSIRDAWEMLKTPIDKNDIGPYREMRDVFQKSIVLAHDLRAGSIITMNDLAFKKPGDGILAANYQNIVGRTTLRDLTKDHKLSNVDFE